ncbi:MAG TPA: HlyD family secretion protein [Rhabdochlamydiaceae bacterium]|nr:HlyD family secretion protein [Rhabdochlamydiaceae bacterium]
MEDKIPSVFKEKRGVYYIAIGVAVVAIAIFWWWRANIYPYESSGDANIEGLALSVSSLQGGQIQRMAVDEGSVVKQGDHLFMIDDSLLKTEKSKAKAALAHAQDEADLQMIRRDLARDDFERARVEFKSGIIPQEAREHALKNLEMMEAQLLSVLSLVEVQKAELEAVELRMNLCHIKASSDGVIAKKWRSPGDVVGEGQTVLSLYDLSKLWVSANFEETKISQLQVGDRVIISVDAYPNEEFEGKVMVIGAAAASQFALIPSNNAAGNFTKVTQRIPLKISFKSSENHERLYLRPGMSVTVKVRIR